MNVIIDVNFDKIDLHLREGMYRYIGSGSGRRVFDLDNGYVVKVAKNRKGIAQNQVEYKIALSDHSNLFAKILMVSKDYGLLIMEKADRIQSFSYVFKYYNVKSFRELFRLEQIRDNLSQYNLIAKDLTRASNWGIVNNRPVIVDYGFTYLVRRKYYSPFWFY